MKTHPFLFSTAMVVALLNGSKKQTRRTLTTRNTLIDGSTWSQHGTTIEELDFENAYVDGGPSPAGNSGPYLKVPHLKNGTVHRIYPKILVDDTIWVRETYVSLCPVDKNGVTDFNSELIFYRADGQPDIVLYNADGFEEENQNIKWKPSIFMPKNVCRLFYKVVEIKIERVQDISEKDAVEEGICTIKTNDKIKIYRDYMVGKDVGVVNPILSFKTLWESINGKASLKANPWVIAYVLKRIVKPDNF